MIKKGFWVTFILGLVFLLAVGCSSNNSSQQDDGAEPGENGAEELSGEITVWGWNIAAASMELAVPAFNELYPNVTVKVEDIGRLDVYDRLTVGLAAGGSGLPDVVLVESDRLDNYKKEFPDGLLNLSEYGYDQYEDRFGPSKLVTAKNENGDFIAMPWDIGPAAVFYRVDYFEEAGVDPESIETWNDFIEAGKKIKEVTGAYMVPIDISGDDALFRIMLNQQGSYYFDENGNIDIASEEAVKALTVIKELYDHDLVANISGWDGVVTATVNGSVATVPFGVWYSGTIMDQAPDQEGLWDIFLLPAFEPGGNRAANLGGTDLVIPASSQNKEAAYAFAEFFTTNADIQVEVLKEYGIFPSLLEAYVNPYFDESLTFFNNKPIFREFAQIVPEIPSANYTNDYPRGLRYAADAQAAALLDGKDPAEALREAAERLANETGRPIN